MISLNVLIMSQNGKSSLFLYGKLQSVVENIFTLHTVCDISYISLTVISFRHKDK